MNSYPQKSATTCCRAAAFFILLLIIAAYSAPVAAQRITFQLNHHLNPLKSFMIASKSESHPFFVDIDADGDLDCFVGEYTNGGAANFSKVYYFRNIGNRTNAIYKLVSGTNNPLNKVQTNMLSIPYFVDIDADRDYDCFIGEGNTGALLYYKNEGTSTLPIFKKQSAAFNPLSLVKFSASGVANPGFGDMDGDGDQDCVITDQAGRLNYFRNTGTVSQPRFEHVTSGENPFAAVANGRGIYNLSFADWNKDGLLDVFINTTYYKNTGTKQRARFTPGTNEQDAPLLQKTIADRYTYTPLRLADLDGDGIPEVFQGTAKGGFIYQSITGSKVLPVLKVANMGVAPNPSNNTFEVNLAPTGAKTSTIRIMDVQGKLMSVHNVNSSTIKVGESLKPGVYVLQVVQSNKIAYEQKIVKQ